MSHIKIITFWVGQLLSGEKKKKLILFVKLQFSVNLSLNIKTR